MPRTEGTNTVTPEPASDWRISHCDLPIILVHGIARFDALARELLDDDDGIDDETHYFRLIRSSLLAKGFNVHHSSVSFAGSVDLRSRQLKENVERVLHETGAPKVHIIAHSMGGLDARHMLFDHQDERIHERIASLTTMGTPHLETSFADWGMRHTDELLPIGRRPRARWSASSITFGTASTIRSSHAYAQQGLKLDLDTLNLETRRWPREV